MTDEAEISRKYRQLEAAEPPRALDEAILAAARREAGAGQRWYAPLATAAVLVLAVAVTLNMQFERPGIESPAPQPAPQRADQPAAVASSPDAKEELKLKASADLKLAPKPAAEADTSVRRRDVGQAASAPVLAPATPAAPAAREPQPFAAERAPRMGAIQSLAKRAERAEAQEKLQAAKLADTPERELERIAELRAQGGHEEADKALADFRKRFPEFRIPDATRERVERR